MKVSARPLFASKVICWLAAFQRRAVGDVRDSGPGDAAGNVQEAAGRLAVGAVVGGVDAAVVDHRGLDHAIAAQRAAMFDDDAAVVEHAAAADIDGRTQVDRNG
jgi:hypothetical protein